MDCNLKKLVRLCLFYTFVLENIIKLILISFPYLSEDALRALCAWHERSYSAILVQFWGHVWATLVGGMRMKTIQQNAHEFCTFPLFVMLTLCYRASEKTVNTKNYFWNAHYVATRCAIKPWEKPQNTKFIAVTLCGSFISNLIGFVFL